MLKRVTKDFETRSKANLKVVGAYKYSLDPSTQPTCLAFKLSGEKRIYFLDFYAINRQWTDQPKELRDLWTRLILEGYEFSAHNSFFERCIYDNILVKRYGWPAIPPRQRRCTAAKAAACALPRNLAGAGEAMRLRVQKDFRGYQAMMATCKPTRQYNAWCKLQEKVKSGARITEKTRLKAQLPAPPVFLEPLKMADIKRILTQNVRNKEDPIYKRAAVWDTLYTYCKIDVKAEEELDEALPDLIPSEQQIWFFNQKLNWRGLYIDIPLAQKISDIMAIESKKKLKELDKLTMGLITKPGARVSILEFLALDDIILPNLQKKTVEDSLSGFDMAEDMRRLLEIRQALSMTSTKKYHTFLGRANDDHRVRDILLYHGASTGRDTGVGIQPHNFPRGIIEFDDRFPYEPVENVRDLDLDMLKLLYGESLPMVFSSILRNMILPSPGKKIFVADFSKIEVAVCWWLANNKPGIKILTDGGDPYITLAAMNLGMSYEKIKNAVDRKEHWASEARQLAKHQILGCQFGMGWKKFKSTGWDLHRLKLGDKKSKFAVKQYRKLFPRVPELWGEYEQAAIDAIENKGRVYTAGKCKFFVQKKFLWIELPSGRRLAYREPCVTWRVREYEKEIKKRIKGKIKIVTVKRFTKPMKTIEFMAVNSKTKKWGPERTWGGPICENITQGCARDLMMPAMVRLEKRGYQGLLMVHDESLTEKEKGTGSVEEFIKIMCEVPPWARGLPIEAKGWCGPRYRK
jgi:DNA polymerase